MLKHLNEFFKKALLNRSRRKEEILANPEASFNDESLKSNDNLFKGVPLEHVESDTVLKLKN